MQFFAHLWGHLSTSLKRYFQATESIKARISQTTFESTSVINAISFDICKYCPHYTSATGYENRALSSYLIWSIDGIVLILKWRRLRQKIISVPPHMDRLVNKRQISLDLVAPWISNTDTTVMKKLD